MERIEKEKNIVQLMIKLYCDKKHKHRNEICNECQKLLNYAHEKLKYCKHGEKKSSCKKCIVQCYRQEMKERIKEVMKFSGPRMILYRPFEFFRHIIIG